MAFRVQFAEYAKYPHHEVTDTLTSNVVDSASIAAGKRKTVYAGEPASNMGGMLKGQFIVAEDGTIILAMIQKLMIDILSRGSRF